MLKLLTVIGARPQIIKAAAMSRAIRDRYATQVEEHLLHTGQHYDSAMSQQFFDELDLAQPTINLGIGSAPHGAQTARMLEGIEQVLQTTHYDGLIVYGDTNSTLAGALAASKMQVPVFHIEAGLRSYNMTMPEEQNRLVADQVASICFAPTATALDNLRREGMADSPALFTHGRAKLAMNCGDVMLDNTRHYAPLATRRHPLLAQHGLHAGDYILATVHRNYNTDSPERLKAIFDALQQCAERHHTHIVMPMHPRTAHLLPATLQARLADNDRFLILPPASYLDTLALEQGARVVMTDSGGVQKEAFFAERPCVILRPETEWTEIVDHGAGLLADADPERIVAACDALWDSTIHFPPLFGDGHAAEHIIETIINYLN